MRGMSRVDGRRMMVCRLKGRKKEEREKRKDGKMDGWMEKV